MLRSLTNSASGMDSQAKKVDVIAHNLANLNTTGYKKQRVSFTEMYYQTLHRPGLPVNDQPPGNKMLLQGTGVKVKGMERFYGQGSLMESGRKLDFAVQGPGFFEVELPEGQRAYTRDGTFHLDRENNLVTAQGYRLTAPVFIPPAYSELTVNPSGIVTGKGPEGDLEELGIMTLYTVSNPLGLEARGENLYLPTEASGPVQEGLPNSEGFGQIKQGFLENSNVLMVEEMTELIAAQRSYQLNSRALQTADEMWSMANNLRR